MKNKNKWSDIYEYRRMIRNCKVIKNNSCDEDECDLMDEQIADFENRIREIIGV